MLNLFERPYEEIVEDCLTQITGGETNEEIIYDSAEDSYSLQSTPVTGITSITGQVLEERFTFEANVDYRLNADKTAVEWIEGGAKPDDGSTFYVDYYPENANPTLTDRNVGSVVRTLAEAFSREVATVYSKINLAYLSGFVDHATGRSLDFVVSILGVQRKQAEFAEGEVTFFRSTGYDENITIPVGTEVATASDEVASVVFQTTAERTMHRGQIRVDVPIRAKEASGEEGIVEAGAITEMPSPIMGLDRVNNFEPTVLGAEAETDEELRIRAKSALRAAGKGTVEALRSAALGQRANSVTITENPRGIPGEVDMIVDCDREREEKTSMAVSEVKAAGINVNLRFVEQVWLMLSLELTVKTSITLTRAEEKRLKERTRESVKGYIDELGISQEVWGNRILALLLIDPRIQAVAFKSVQTYKLGRQTSERMYDHSLRLKELSGRNTPDEEEIATGSFQIEITNAERARMKDEDLIVEVKTVSPEAATESLERREKRRVATPAEEATAVSFNVRVEASPKNEALRPGIEQQVRFYFSTLGPGDAVIFEDVSRHVSDRLSSMGVDLRSTKMTVFHAVNGMSVSLSQSGDIDFVGESEVVESITVDVKLVE